MNRIALYIIGLFVLVIGSFSLSGCMRDDDEPAIPRRPISRLYVSLSSIQTNEALDPYPNLAIFDPADGTTMEDGLAYDTKVIGGSGVHFNPFGGRLFHASYQDSIIQMMGVSDVGIPGSSGFLFHDKLTAMRGLTYNHETKELFVANVQSPTGIFVFKNPENRRSSTKPDKFWTIGNVRPWGLAMFGDNLLVTRTGENGGFNLYENVSQADSTGSNLQLKASLTIPGAVGIRGIAYSAALDILVLSDEGADANESGKVYIFDNASALFEQTSGNITPSRTLSGPNTGIRQPVDISIDDREDSRLLYVADRQTGNYAVMRFNLSDNGNATPIHRTTFDLRPAGIFIDARGIPGAE